MSDLIRYAWGTSSLGDFMVAASESGLVAFEFATPWDTVLDRLRERMPQARFEPDEAGLADTLARLVRLVDHPEEDPGLALDPRGNGYQLRVWQVLREIPAGATLSYGEVAARLGTRDARDATKAIADNALAILVPCHRVLKKDGSISGYRWGVRRKRALLERERRGVAQKAA
jgi:AraC family transcriptional regulator, regulatory protein of adaptative response / methylated-DNA-[protein]-cysteine methyltransferase